MLKFVRMIAVTLATVCFGMSAHAAATVDDAKAYAHQVGDQVIAVLDDKALNDDSKIQKLEALFTDVVDVKWIGRFVLGTAWRSATPEQQQAYLDAYGKFLVKNYTSNFAEYGGETFVVSLALALGLADVITEEAGGTDLDTLFVDEGFGSLDPHTLDVVLAELGRLRAGGRVIGVVSHVETLKQSIADRIEVQVSVKVAS